MMESLGYGTVIEAQYKKESGRSSYGHGILNKTILLSNKLL